ncbi:tyrosine-protein phosphatase non-receptor type substrate 1-like [Discoglossus pictus]
MLSAVAITFLSYLLIGDAKVRIQQIPQFISVRPGQHVSMSCTVEGDIDLLTWKLYWKSNGIKIKPRPGGPQIWHNLNQTSSWLSIWFVTVQDSGLYQCAFKITFPDPQNECTANGTRVVIAGKNVVKVLQSPPSINLKMDQTASLSCTMDGAHRSWSWDYEWSLNDSRTVSSLRKHPKVLISRGNDHVSSLLVLSMVTPRDSGLYVCSVRVTDPKAEVFSGNGTWILVTVSPTLNVRMEMMEESQFLVCEAKKFYPQELNVSWNFSLMDLQIQENLTENEDGTYTKTSSVEITEELRNKAHDGVTCYLQHITLTEPISGVLYPPTRNMSGVRISLYLYLFPVRILLFIIPIVYLLIFRIFFHIT